MRNFDDAMLVNDVSEGCTPISHSNARLSTPHSTSMVDFDGDCISDLFLVSHDMATGLDYYEIYLHRERAE